MTEYDVFMTDKEGNKFPIFTIGQDEMDRLMTIPTWEEKFGQFRIPRKLKTITSIKGNKNHYPKNRYWPCIKYLKENGKTSKVKLYALGIDATSLYDMRTKTCYIRRVEGGDVTYALTPRGEEYYKLRTLGFSNPTILRLVEAIKDGHFRTKDDWSGSYNKDYIRKLCIMLRKYIDNGIITDIGYKSELYSQRYYRYTFFPLEQFEQECAEIVC